MVAVRMIEQQRQTLKVMADLIDGFLTMAEPEIARQPALLSKPCVTQRSRALRNGQPNGHDIRCGRPEVPVASGQRPALGSS